MALAVKAAPKAGGGTFRVVVGIHYGPGPAGCECTGCAGRVDWPTHRRLAAEAKAAGEPPLEYLGGQNHLYEAYTAYARRRTLEKQRNKNDVEPILPPEEYEGDLIESATDLERHNGGPGPQFRKFERVHPGQRPGYQQAPEPFPLEQMTVDQLITVAHAEGIDTRGVRSHEALLAKVREHRASPPAPASDDD